MSIESNTELFEKMNDAMNSHDLDQLDLYYTQDLIVHESWRSGRHEGLQNYKRNSFGPFLVSFPDYHTTTSIVVVNEKLIGARGIVTGTHRGEWLGLQPTGRKIALEWSDFWEVRDGLLSKMWTMVDTTDVMAQLGVDLLGNLP